MKSYRSEVKSLFNSIERCVYRLRYVLILLLGITLLSAGAYRFFVIKSTLPSYRLMEIGLLFVLLSFYPIAKKSEIKAINERIFLLVMVIIAFVFNASWSLASPVPLGCDTPYYIEVTKWMAEDFLRALQIGSFMEPLPLLFFAVMYKMGIPIQYIFQVFIPLSMALTLLPFFLLIKRRFDLKTAQIATLFFVFSPYHLRLILDLHRQTFAIFFLICFIYFALYEKGFPWKTLLCGTVLYFSHALPFSIGVSIVLIYSLFAKNKTSARNLIIFLGYMSLVALVTWNCMHWSNKFEIILSRYNKYSLSSFVRPIEKRPRLIHSFIEGVEWGAVLLIVSVFSLASEFLERRVRDLLFAIAMLYLFAVMCSVIYCWWIWGLPERWALHLDIPTSFYASLLIKESKKQKFLLTSILFVHLLSAITFGLMYLVPTRWIERPVWSSW